MEAEIQQRIGAIRDPLQRSLALERLALTKLRMAQFDLAHRTLEQAAAAAFEAPPDLRRDLRMMNLIDLLLDLAYRQIIEGLSSTPLSMDDESEALPPPPSRNERQARLELARAEWQLAYRLAKQIDSINYQCEQLFSIASGEAFGSQLIARSGLRGSLLPFAPDVPRTTLLQVADQLLADAATEATRIPRDIWRDRAVVQVVFGAADSGQFARARQIALSIPYPSPRAEALTRTAEVLVRQAARIESEFPPLVDSAWGSYLSSLATTRSALEADIGLDRLPIEEANYNLQRKQDALNGLIQDSTNLGQRIELLTQVVHDAQIARSQRAEGGTERQPLQNVQELETQLEETLPQLYRWRDQFKEQLRSAQQLLARDIEQAHRSGARSLRSYQDPYLAIAQSIPNSDDQTVIDFGANLSLLAQLATRTAHSALLPEATEVYNLAARAVASVQNADPRNDVAQVLVDSLITVARFDDARAAVRLLPGTQRQLGALGRIAEAQGRRGLASSAYAWIDRDVPPEYRAQLYRDVEQGVLTTIDEYRQRRTPSMSRR